MSPYEGGEGESRSQSAIHMHLLVCICSNVRQFRMRGGRGAALRHKRRGQEIQKPRISGNMPIAQCKAECSSLGANSMAPPNDQFGE